MIARPRSQDAPDVFGLGLQEMRAEEITGDLRGIRQLAIDDAVDMDDEVTYVLTSKGIDYGTITALADATTVPKKMPMTTTHSGDRAISLR